MQIKLLHLYYDLMNLYGEIGNMLILVKHLKEQGFNVTIDKKSIGDDLSFQGYTLIYSGSGTESSQKAALTHLLAYKEDLKNVAENGTIFLFTGNSFEMLGETIFASDGTRYQGIGLSSFETTETKEIRHTGDAIFHFAEIDTPLVGFINKCTEITGITAPLFSVKMGLSNHKGEKSEGFRYQNVFGTHLIGPILVKNPAFLRYLIELIGSTCDEFTYQQQSHPYEQKAYETTLQELLKREA